MTLSIPQHLAALENRLTSLGMVSVDGRLDVAASDPAWVKEYAA